MVLLTKQNLYFFYFWFLFKTCNSVKQHHIYKSNFPYYELDTDVFLNNLLNSTIEHVNFEKKYFKISNEIILDKNFRKHGFNVSDSSYYDIQLFVYNSINKNKEEQIIKKQITRFQPWSKKKLSWCFYNTDQLILDKFLYILIDIFNAFTMWEKLNIFEFVNRKCEKEVDIKFLFCDLFSSFDIFLAKSLLPLNNTPIECCINANINWVLNPKNISQMNTFIFYSHQEVYYKYSTSIINQHDNDSNKIYFFSIILHEIGHMLGLLDNKNEKSIMYYRNQNKLYLDESDKTNLKTLYSTNKEYYVNNINMSNMNTTLYFYFNKMLLHHPFVYNIETKRLKYLI